MNANKQDAGGEVTNPDNVGGLPVSLNPIGYVDLASWQTDWNAGESFFTDYQDEDTQPIYTQAQMERAIELCRAAPAGGDDLYRQACESVEEWKARALEAEADIARIHAQINAENGPTFMGEPVVSAPAVGRPYGGDPAEPRDDSDRYDSAPAGSGEVQWPPRAMRGDDYVMLDDGRETLPLMSGCKGCRADEAGTWNRCIDECQKAVAKASGAGPDAFRLARWLEIHFRGEFPTPEFREIHAALLRKLQQGADYVVVPNRPTEAMEKAAAHWQRTYYDCDPLGDRGRFYRGIYDAMIAASQGQEGGTNG